MVQTIELVIQVFVGLFIGNLLFSLLFEGISHKVERLFKPLQDKVKTLKNKKFLEYIVYVAIVIIGIVVFYTCGIGNLQLGVLCGFILTVANIIFENHIFKNIKDRLK